MGQSAGPTPGLRDAVRHRRPVGRVVGELGALEAAGSDSLLGVQAVLDGQVADGVRPPTALKGGLSMSMLAGGVRGDLVDSGVGSFGLAFSVRNSTQGGLLTWDLIRPGSPAV